MVTKMVTVAVGRGLSSQVAVSEHRQYFCRVMKAVLFKQEPPIWDEDKLIVLVLCFIFYYVYYHSYIIFFYLLSVFEMN